MPEEVTETPEIVGTPVGPVVVFNERPVPGVKRDFKATKANDPYMSNLKVSVDKDGKPIPDESDLVNLDELIQTYKEQCGMNLALRMIKLGQLDPQSLADDGKHSGDLSGIPTDPQGIANAAVASADVVAALKVQLGLKPDEPLPDSAIDGLIRDYIQSNLDKFVKPAEPTTSDGGAK